MKIVHKQTLEVFEPQEVSARHPHIAFDFSDEGLDGSDYAILQMPDEPVYDSRYQRVTVGDVVESDGVYSSDWVPEYIELTGVQRAELIAEKRYDVETGGINILGYDVPTDRSTQSVLTAMYIRALASSEYSVRFKASSGFIDLTADHIILVAEAVHDHVQAAFAREDELIAAIEQGKLITPDDWE